MATLAPLLAAPLLVLSADRPAQAQAAPPAKHAVTVDDLARVKTQVWLLSRSGGEAQRLTDLPGGVSDFEWSPDSRRLALVSSDADPDEEPKKKEGWKRKTKPPIVITRYHFKQDREGYLKTLHSHLHLFDVAARKAEPLTSGPWDDEDPSTSRSPGSSRCTRRCAASGCPASS